MGADAIIIVDLALIALALFGSLALFAFQSFYGTPSGEPDELPQWAVDLTLLVGVIISFALFGAMPLWWLSMTRVGGWGGAMVALRLRRAGSALPMGALLGLALAALAMGLLVILDLLGVPLPTDATEMQVGWFVAIAIAVGAGVGEEIFFRGVLQRWLGLWGQAAVFGLFHLANGGLLPLLITGSLGLLFGWLYKRGASLWLLMAAHTMYDLVLLLLPLVLGDL